MATRKPLACEGCEAAQARIAELEKPRPPVRRRLPDDRRGLTKRIHLLHAGGDLKIYLQSGEYADGSLAEIFIKADQAGSTISGLLDALSVASSIALQYGAPVETLIDKWSRMQFEPSGTTSGPDACRVSSIMDAVARWLHARYAKKEIDISASPSS